MLFTYYSCLLLHLLVCYGIACTIERLFRPSTLEKCTEANSGVFLTAAMKVLTIAFSSPRDVAGNCQGGRVGWNIT